MSIRYSPRALADLREISEYLEPKSARGAAAVLQRIELAVKVIERIRLVGRAVKARTGVRVLPVGKYPNRIFFIGTSDGTTILHIRHTARRAPSRQDLED